MTTDITPPDQKPEPALTAYEQKKKDRWGLARALAHSEFCPRDLQGKVTEVAIILQQAETLQVDGRSAIDNIHVVHGRAGYSSKFLIGLANQRGAYVPPMRFKFEGTGWDCKVTAYVKLEDGDFIYGPPVDREMVERCRWDSNPKHKELPEQMRAYRAGQLLLRLVAPETTMGMLSVEEIEDIHYAEARVVEPQQGAVAELAADLAGTPEPEPEEEPPTIDASASVVEPEPEEDPDNPFAGWTDSAKQEDPA